MNCLAETLCCRMVFAIMTTIHGLTCENFCYGVGTALGDIGWQVYAGLVALLAGSAFFSASETAFATVNTIRLKNHADAGNRKAVMALRIAEMYEKTLSRDRKSVV